MPAGAFIDLGDTAVDVEDNNELEDKQQLSPVGIIATAQYCLDVGFPCAIALVSAAALPLALLNQDTTSGCCRRKSCYCLTHTRLLLFVGGAGSLQPCGGMVASAALYAAPWVH